MLCFGCLFVFFFKQKKAYGGRIRDWISDVCSSDLGAGSGAGAATGAGAGSTLAGAGVADQLRDPPRPAPMGVAEKPPNRLACGCGSSTARASMPEIGRASRRERVWQYV